MSKFLLSSVALLSLNAVNLSAFVEELPDYEENLMQNEVAIRPYRKPSACVEECLPPAPVHCVVAPPPCEPLVMLPSLPCPEHWRLSGDFLYFLPTVDDTYFVLDSDISTAYPNGERENNDFGFSPGFRLGAEYAMCDKHREFQAYYSHLNVDQDENISGSHLWASAGSSSLSSFFEDYSGTASSNLNLLYQQFETNFSQRVLNTYGIYFYIQPGIEYAYLRLAEKLSYISHTENGEINRKSTNWGVGPQIGLGFDYNFYEGKLTCSMTQTISITTLFSGSILMGQGKTEDHEVVTGDNIVNVRDENTWRTIPALHARVGLNYLVHRSKMGFSLGAGYEFDSYIRGLARSTYPGLGVVIAENSIDAGNGLSTNEYFNFDVQGFYLRAALSF